MSPQLRWLLFMALLVLGCATPRTPTLLDAPTPSHDSFAEHVAQAGETWERISELYFGDGSKAERIAAESGASLQQQPKSGARIRVRIAPREMQEVRRIELARGPYNEGVALLRAGGKDAAALLAFERALDTAPNFVDARYNRGLALLRLQRSAEAVAELGAVAKQRPADKDVHYALASANFQRQEFEAALRAVDVALALDARFLRAQYTRAMSLQKLGRAKDARSAWKRYLELDKSSAWADEARRQLRQL